MMILVTTKMVQMLMLMLNVVVTSTIIVDLAVENAVGVDLDDDDDFLGGSHQSNFSPHCPISCE